MPNSNTRFYVLLPLLITLCGCSSSPQKQQSDISKPVDKPSFSSTLENDVMMDETDGAINFDKIKAATSSYIASSSPLKKINGMTITPLAVDVCLVTIDTDKGISHLLSWKLIKDNGDYYWRDEPNSDSMSALLREPRSRETAKEIKNWQEGFDAAQPQSDNTDHN